MGKIYKKAEACFVYLGEATQDTVVAFQWARKIASIGPAFKEYMRDGVGLEMHNLPPRDDPCWLTLQLDLPLRPWFRRTWVVQEVCFARKVYIFMGGTRCSVLSLEELCSAFNFLPNLVIGRHIGESEKQKIAAGILQMDAVQWLRHQIEAGRSASIYYTVGDCWLSECRDPRDKIYAMLGFLPESQASEIPVDYGIPWKTFYERVARCLVSWGLGCEMFRFAGIDTTAAGSPTWVPNWNPPITAPQRGSPFLSDPDNPYRAGGEARAQIRLSPNGLVFMAWGMMLDTVTWMSRVAPSAKDDLVDWEAPVRRKILATFNRYRNGQSIARAYRTTLVAGSDSCGEGRVDQNVLSEAYEAWHDQSWRKHVSSRDDYAYYKACVNEFDEWSERGVQGMRICITARGYIGLVPSNTKLQDRVVILSGQ